MVTDEIQELLEGTMEDGRMAELLHTLSVSPEKRKALREHLLLNQEVKDDRYASALTFSEDAAVWESIAAAGALTASTASTAGRAIGVWAGRVAALVVVGVAGYILGSNTSTTVVNNVGAGKAPVTSPAGGSSVSADLPAGGAVSGDSRGSSANGATGTGTTSNGSLADASTRPGSDRGTRIISPSSSSSPSRSPMGASPAIAQNNVGSGSSRTERSLGIRSGVASATRRSETSATAEANGSGGGSGFAGSVDVAREMFDAMDGSSVVTDALSTSALSAPMMAAGDTTPANAASHAAPESAPRVIDTVAPRTEAALRRAPVPTDIPIEGEEHAGPLSAYFKNGFESAFSERLGMLLTGSDVSTEGAGRSFSYHAIDLGYRLNGGALGFGIRLGYGTFSRVQLDVVPMTRADEAGVPDMVNYSSSLVAVRRMSGELFINYRHPISERIALGLEAFIGGSSSHQQGGVDLSMVAFLNESFGLQIGGGAGTYWYRIDEQWADATKNHGNTGRTDYNSNTAYSGITLIGRYGLFYRF